MLILLLFTCHVSLLSWSIFTFILTYYLLLFILWPLFILVTNTFFVILQISILLPYQIPYWNRLSFGFLSFWRCKGSTVCAHSKEFLRFFPIFYLFLDMRQSDEFKWIWLLYWRGVSNPQHQQIHVICLRPPTLWWKQSKKIPILLFSSRWGLTHIFLYINLEKKSYII